MSYRIRGIVLGAALAVVAAVLTLPSVNAPVATASVKTVKVKIVDDANTIGRYSPTKITVHKGEKIAFRNSSSTIHTVTSDKAKIFNSKDIATGHTWTYTANRVGTFKYHCKYHPGMHGEIIVKP